MNRFSKVLLVDDCESDIIVIKRAFEDGQHKCTVDAVTNGRDALQTLAQAVEEGEDSFPDLMLLDINMPVLGGKETLAAIRGDARLQQLPLIMLSTSNYQSDITECYQLGANAYLTKPNNFTGYNALIDQISGFWLELAKLPTKLGV